MHKKLSLFLLIALVMVSFACTGHVLAVSATPSSEETVSEIEEDSSSKNQKIEDLKERLATKVAELQQTQRRAVYGTVKAVSLSSLTLSTEKNDIKIELNDDIAVFQNIKGKRTELTIEDVEKEDVITVFGEYDTSIDVLKPKVIVIQGSTETQIITGTIKETSKKNYTLTVESKDGKETVVDFETTTKTSVWNGSEKEKGGFSKLVVGDTVVIAGTAVPKKENRISASRILILGNPSGATPSPTPLPEKEASPSETSKPSPTPEEES